MSGEDNARTSLIVAIATQIIWGLLPLWTALYSHTPTMQMLAWRITFCALTATTFVFALKQHQTLLALLRAPRRWPPYAAAALLLGGNWFGFFHAVDLGRVLEISFGTFLMPLASIGMGVVFLREKLTKWTAAGLIAAALGVGAMLLNAGDAPWIGLYLAGSFSVYTIIRKLNPIAPLVGLTFESWVLTLGVLAYFLLDPHNVILGPTGDLAHTAWMVSFGPQTALTMAMFNFATHHLRLSTTGMLQFLSPTIVFMIALSRGEPLVGIKIVGFTLIWIGVACYIIDAVRARAAHKAEMARTIETLDVR